MVGAIYGNYTTYHSPKMVPLLEILGYLNAVLAKA